MQVLPAILMISSLWLMAVTAGYTWLIKLEMTCSSHIMLTLECRDLKENSMEEADRGTIRFREKFKPVSLNHMIVDTV